MTVTLRLDASEAEGYYSSVTLMDDETPRWTAFPRLGQTRDWWTAARLTDDAVVAYAWSGFSVHLDLATGAVSEAIFTK